MGIWINTIVGGIGESKGSVRMKGSFLRMKRIMQEINFCSPLGFLTPLVGIVKKVAIVLVNGGRLLAIFEGIRAHRALEGRHLTIFRRPPFCHNPFSTLFEPLSRLGSPCLPLFLCPQAWSLSSGHKCDHSPPITMRELKTKTAQHTPND